MASMDNAEPMETVGRSLSPSSLPTVNSELIKSPRLNSNQNRRRTNLVLALILCVATLERVSFYSVQDNLQNILDKYFPDANIKIVWMLATTRVLTLVGAWLGENKMGVYRSVIIGLILELIATLLFLPMLPGIANTLPDRADNATNATIISPIVDSKNNVINNTHNLAPGEKSSVILGLISLTLGLTLTRTHILVLAVQQIPEENITDSCFFIWFFWFIELGKLGGSAISVIPSYYCIVILWPLPLVVAFFLILILPCFANGLCIRPSAHAFRVLLRSLRQTLPSPFKIRIPTEVFNRLTDSVRVDIERRESDLERLSIHVRRIALLITLSIVFECLYGLQTIGYQLLIPDRSYSSSVNLGIKTIFHPVAVMVITPILCFILMPILRRCWPAARRPLRLMGAGMLLMALSCLAAVLFQIFKQSSLSNQDIIFEIPRNLLLGLAEIFAYAITYEFIYLETPKGLRNMMLGLYFCCMGLGLYLSIAILAIIQTAGVDIDKPDKKYLVQFLSGLAAAQIVALIFYTVLTHRYSYSAQYDRSVSAAIDAEDDDWISSSSDSDSD